MNWGADLAAIYYRYGARPGIMDAEGLHTIGEVIDRAAGLADHLCGQGVGPGTFVATILHNSALAASASYAVALTGATEVPVNPLLSAGELEHALTCAGVRIVLADTDAIPVTGVSVLDARAIGARPFSTDGWPDVDPDAPSRIVFTSGTTGFPKGAIHSHRGRWAANLLLRASLPLMPDRSSRILLMTPFSHGSSLLTFAYLAHGASVHLMEGVNAETVLPLLSSGEISEMFAPPTVLAKLTEAAMSAQIRPRLRMVLTGTAPLSPSLYRRAADLFGEVIRVTYGKSEVFNPITALEPEETAAAYAAPLNEGLCVGWPATGVRIALRDDDGVRLPPGEIGEIHIHAQHMFTGYMTRDGLRMLSPGEFHATGDLGVMDEAGRLHLVARQSDMMKTGGYKVSPDEVERALAPALPGTDLVVLGYPSEYWGEIVTVIAQRPPADWRERIAPAMAALTSYKRPRLFAAIDELPRNTIGKIVRPRLRQWLSETYDLTERPRPSLVPKPGADPTEAP